MQIPEQAQRLTLYAGELDKWRGVPLYEAVILRARESGIAGATMTRGLMGYGAASRIHTAKILRLSEDLPIIIQIVDSPEKIAAFLPPLREMAPTALITVEDLRVVPL